MKKLFGVLLASLAMISMTFMSCNSETESSSKPVFDVTFTDKDGEIDYTEEVYVVEEVSGILQTPTIYLRSELSLEKYYVVSIEVEMDDDIEEVEDFNERFNNTDKRKERKQYKLDGFNQVVKNKPGEYLVTLWIGLDGDDNFCEPVEITIKIPGNGSVVNAPKITTNIVASNNATVKDGTTLTVVATGDNLTYQWYKDGNAIPGEKESSYEVDGVGSYKVVVSNDGGSVESYVAVVIPEGVVLPTVTLNPKAMEIADLNKNTTNLTAKATASGAKITAQWFCDGVSVSGVENATGDITSSINPTVFGTYVCKFTATKDEKTSPVIETEPAVVEESDIVISIDGISAVGYVGNKLVAKPYTEVPCNYTYEWYIHGNDSGIETKQSETSDTFTLTEDIFLQFSADESVNVYVKVTAISKATGTYNVKESSVCRFELPSNVAIPTFTVQPTAQEQYFCDETVTLSVTATVTDGGTVTYQWYKGETEITEATSATYNVKLDCTKDCDKTLSYYVIATNTKDGETASSQSDTVRFKVAHKGDDNGSGNGSFQF